MSELPSSASILGRTAATLCLFPEDTGKEKVESSDEVNAVTEDLLAVLESFPTENKSTVATLNFRRN